MTATMTLMISDASIKYIMAAKTPSDHPRHRHHINAIVM